MGDVQLLKLRLLKKKLADTILQLLDTVGPLNAKNVNGSPALINLFKAGINRI